jgi:hypothetical protein
VRGHQMNFAFTEFSEVRAAPSRCPGPTLGGGGIGSPLVFGRSAAGGSRDTHRRVRPGRSGAHAAVECVELDDLEVLRRVLLSTAEVFCA